MPDETPLTEEELIAEEMRFYGGLLAAVVHVLECEENRCPAISGRTVASRRIDYRTDKCDAPQCFDDAPDCWIDYFIANGATMRAKLESGSDRQRPERDPEGAVADDD